MLFDQYVFPAWALFGFIAVFLANWLLFFRRASYGFLDPLNTQVNPIYSAGVVVSYIVATDATTKIHNLILTVAQVAAVLLALTVIPRFSSRLGVRKSASSSLPPAYPDYASAAALIVFAIAIVAFHSKFGLPFLYDNPLDSKLMYEGGGGAFRRFLEAATNLLLIVLSVTAARSGRVVYAYIAALGVVLSTLYIVSKGGALTKMLMIIFLLQMFGRQDLARKLFKVLPSAVAVSIAAVYITLTSVLPNVEFIDVAKFFGTRILAFGDAFFYLLTLPSLKLSFSDDSFSSLIFTNLSPFLASMRIIDWSEAISTGGRIYADVTGIYSGVGPNASTAVDSSLFLGAIGPVYTFFYVSTVILLRDRLATFRARQQFLELVLLLTLFMGSTLSLVDGAYIGTTLVDMIFLALTYSVFFVVRLIVGLIYRSLRAHLKTEPIFS